MLAHGHTGVEQTLLGDGGFCQMRKILPEVAGGSEFLAMFLHGKSFADFPYLDDTVKPMLDDLVWWANTLKAGREKKAA